MSAPVYDRNRFPKQLGHRKCRGCNSDVPKARATWCSNECFDKFEPSRVRLACKNRDNGVCCICGVDTKRMRARFDAARFEFGPNRNHYYGSGGFDKQAFERAVTIFERRRTQRNKAGENRRRRMLAEGWPVHSCRNWWEMDHIIPYSEGGLTVLENVRTLCVVCHKKRTKKWHKDRKRVDRAELFSKES